MPEQPPSPISNPSQEDLQRLHEQRLNGLESSLDEARRFIRVNEQQIKLIRQMLGLPPDFRKEPQSI